MAWALPLDKYAEVSACKIRNAWYLRICTHSLRILLTELLESWEAQNPTAYHPPLTPQNQDVQSGTFLGFNRELEKMWVECITNTRVSGNA